MKSRSLLAVAPALAAVPFLPATAADAAPPKHISGNQTIPVYDYTTAVRETVWVQSSVNSGAGWLGKDRVAVDIVRPHDWQNPGLKVPAIVEASPYYRTGGRGNENETKVYDIPHPAGVVTKMPLYYDNYFVPRGYAFLAVDLPGSNRSTGCLDVGGQAELLGTKAVVDWLNGNAKASDAFGVDVQATWFSGKAGLIGKSWDGAIATGVAATGVAGLATVDFRRSVWVATLHRWFDHWLHDLATGIMNDPQATVERAADTWVNLPVWPPAGTTSPVYYLGPGNGVTGELDTAGAMGGTVVVTDVALDEGTATTNPDVAKTGRRVFLTAPLAEDLHIAGSATVTVRLQSTEPTATITARLVDFGATTRVHWAAGQGITTLANETCWGASSLTDDACYKETVKNVITTEVSVLSRGWIDLAHRESLTFPAPMPAQTWQTVTFRLTATDQVVAAGHRLGLVISSTDSNATATAATGSAMTFDLGRSLLRLPTAP